MSYYTSLTGLNAATTDLSVTSNNIANVGTTGFKKSSAQFGDIVANSAFEHGTASGLGTGLRAITQEFTQGSFQTTDQTLDLALSGQGFFVTRSQASGPSAASLTRDGAFGTDADGNVTDGAGGYLQVIPAGSTASDVGSLTTLRVPPTNTTNGVTAKLSGLTIGTDGQVTAAYSDGTTSDLGRVAVGMVADPQGLLQTGDNKWSATPASGTVGVSGAGSDGMGLVKSGTLEVSNVDVTAELVKLIQAQRNFQANAKAIDTANQISETAVNLRN